MSGGDNMKNRASYTREGRKQLFAVLQSARGSSGGHLMDHLSTCALLHMKEIICFKIIYASLISEYT